MKAKLVGKRVHDLKLLLCVIRKMWRSFSAGYVKKLVESIAQKVPDDPRQRQRFQHLLIKSALGF